MIAVLRILTVISCLMYLFTKMKTGFHMLQQESYLNTEYFKWVKKNISKNLTLYDVMPPLAAIAVAACTGEAFGLIVWTVINVFIFCRKIKTASKAKKPLVMTARVKRLTVTAAVLALVLALLWYRLLKTGIPAAALAAAAFNLVTCLYTALVNIINRPAELAVNRWYYNDAKKIVSSIHGLKVVGITGSYGKTSTKFILTKILSEKYHTLMTPESYNTTMGVIKTIRTSLTPAHEIFVCEMGAKYVNDIKEICDLVNPSYGIITSIGPQHLETFGSIENIIKTKLELADAIADKANAVVNVSSKLAAENKPQGAVSYSFSKEEGGEYFADSVSYGPQGASFVMCGAGIEPFKLETRLLGKHNIINVIGAAAMALKLGVPPEKISYAVRRLQPVPHRLEMKKQAGGITVIDDAFNSNVEGAKSAVEVLGSFPQGGRMLITPGMVELGEKEYEYNFEFGAEAAKNCDYIILVGEKQAKPIKDGIEKQGFDKTKLYVAADLNDALAKMRAVAGEGWTVLFENDLPDLYL